MHWTERGFIEAIAGSIFGGAIAFGIGWIVFTRSEPPPCSSFCIGSLLWGMGLLFLVMILTGVGVSLGCFLALHLRGHRGAILTAASMGLLGYPLTLFLLGAIGPFALVAVVGVGIAARLLFDR